MTALVHCFLLESIAFGVAGFLVLFLWWSVRYNELVTVMGLFFSVFFFAMCIRIAIRTLRYCRGWM
jgi:uncharacterized membrane protein